MRRSSIDIQSAQLLWRVDAALSQSWYNDSPADVPHTGPFNAHFVRDLGVHFCCRSGVRLVSAEFGRCYPIHMGLRFSSPVMPFHLVDIASGHCRYAADRPPGVFLPALLMLVA